MEGLGQLTFPRTHRCLLFRVSFGLGFSEPFLCLSAKPTVNDSIFYPDCHLAGKDSPAIPYPNTK